MMIMDNSAPTPFTLSTTRLILRDVKLLVYQWSWKWRHLETKLISISAVCTFFLCWIFRRQPAGTPVTVRMNTKGQDGLQVLAKRFSLRARSSRTDLNYKLHARVDPLTRAIRR
jgi:hypothetical protein